MVYEFGHYIPFLGAFFGINVLFGAWDGVYNRLYSESSEEAEEHEKQWDKDATAWGISKSEKDELRDNRKRNTRNRERIKAGGHFIGLTIAAAIAVAFFLVKRTACIPGWMSPLMALPAILPISALLLMWLNNRGLKKIRNRENETLRQKIKAMDNAANDRTGPVQEKIVPPAPPMSKDKFVLLVERLIEGGYITGPVTCRSPRGGRPFLCVDNRTEKDLTVHLKEHNPHGDPPDVRSLSNGMWVAVPRSDSWRHERARQLLEALGLDPGDYL